MYLRVHYNDETDLKDLLEKIIAISAVAANYGVVPQSAEEKKRLWWVWEKPDKVVSLSPVSNDYKIFIHSRGINSVVLRFWSRYDDKMIESLVSLLHVRFKFCTFLTAEN